MDEKAKRKKNISVMVQKPDLEVIPILCDKNISKPANRQKNTPPLRTHEPETRQKKCHDLSNAEKTCKTSQCERTNERTNEDQKVQSAEVDEVLNMYRRAGERKGELNS